VRHSPEVFCLRFAIMYRMAWTDERMDEFARHNDQRFDAVDKRFDAVDKRFDAVDRRFDSIDKRLERLGDRFATLQLTLLVFCGTIIAALIGLIATQL
jgi:hypothetical protein